MENPVTVPTASESQAPGTLYAPEALMIPHVHLGAQGFGFSPWKWPLPEGTSARLLASFLDLKVSIGRRVWKTKLKVKTGLFVFKCQHTLVYIIAKDKWDEVEERKSEIE